MACHQASVCPANIAMYRLLSDYDWGMQVQCLSQHPRALVEVLLAGGLPERTVSMWALTGQLTRSCALQVQYLSQHPQALVEVLLTGGLPPGMSLSAPASCLPS